MLEKETLRRVLIKHGFKETDNYGMKWYKRGAMSFRLGYDKVSIKSIYFDFSIPYDDLVAMHGGTYIRIAHTSNSIRLTQSLNIVDQVAEMAHTCGAMDCYEECPYAYTEKDCPFYSEESGHPCEWAKVKEIVKYDEHEEDYRDDDDCYEKVDRDITWAGRNDELCEMEKYR